MKYISSQHYRDWDIVSEKIAALESDTPDHVTIPCWYVGEIDGEEYAMVNDGHHLMEAARQLEIPVEFDVTDDPEGLTGTNLLNARWMDGDWYDVETSDVTAEHYDLIW